jgi:hypothetical protein
LSLRERKEVQEMLRCLRVRRLPRAAAGSLLLICLFLSPGLVRAAIWPDNFGTFAKTSAAPVAVTDRALWDEYGLDEAEKAEYAVSDQRFTATAYRLADPTGALAAFQWLRPADARPSDIGEHAAETPGMTLLAFGNYLFRFEGRRPEVEELAALFGALPLLDQSALPALSGYLPADNLVPNSQRFVTGPTSLERFEPGIPPSVAAFHYGTEAQLGKYRAGAAEMLLAVFSYPTPQIARERVIEFQQLPGALAKRSGPLVAVILSPSDADEAERILSKVRYQAKISWSEYVPTRRDNVGHLILTIFMLIGVLLAFAIVSGLALGGIRTMLRLWLGRGREEDSIILLNLRER